LSEATADDAEASELLARLMMTESAESFDETLAAADSCLNALRLMKWDRRIDELRSEIAEAERAGDTERSVSLQLQHLEVIKQRDAVDALLPRGHGMKAS
jgi:hypothetical protein